MKKIFTYVLIFNLIISGFAFSSESSISGGTIPGTISVGVDLLAPKSTWQSVKEHFNGNWGKYTIGLIVSIIGGLVYVNNKGFHGKDSVSTVSTSTDLVDSSLNITVSGSYNTISVYSNRNSDNGKD